MQIKKISTHTRTHIHTYISMYIERNIGIDIHKELLNELEVKAVHKGWFSFKEIENHEITKAEFQINLVIILHEIITYYPYKEICGKGIIETFYNFYSNSMRETAFAAINSMNEIL